MAITIESPSQELLPNIIDQNAVTDPNRVIVEYPNSPTSYDKGFRKVTTNHFANAVNGLANWLETATGGNCKSFETVAYIGPNDLRYMLLIPAAVKVGYKTLLLSPRNSLVAQKSLMEQTACTIFIATDPLLPAAVTIMDGIPGLSILKMPKLEEILDVQHPHYAYESSFVHAADDPVVIIHTSGSTGIPKPLSMSHRWACALSNIYKIKPPEGYWALNTLWVRQRVYLPMPLFHAAGLINFLNLTYLGNTLILPCSGNIPTANTLLEVSRRTKIGVSQLSPATVLELANQPDLMHELMNGGHEYLFYAGGDLPKEIGDRVSQFFKLYTIMGTSEIGVWPQIRTIGEWANDEWRFVAPHPDAGIQFRNVGDNLYEQWVVRKPEIKDIQPVFIQFPELQEYSTKDLYSKHPSRPGLWEFRGRADDIIVFINGEKTNPVSFEGKVSAHPEVSGALVEGSQRWEACLLVEVKGLPSLTVQERSEVLDRIWPTIEQANKECPAHARVSKDLVFFAKPEKPMCRAGKGTIQRAATIQLYKEEIKTLYADAETMNKHVSTESISTSNAEVLAIGIQQEVQRITMWPRVGLDEDFFSKGMDSLLVLVLARNLRSATLQAVTPDAVYKHSSPRRLAHAILADKDKATARAETASAETENSITKLQKLLTQQLDLLVGSSYNDTGIDNSEAHPNSPGEIVLVTGTTGGLGSYILDTLLKDPSVCHIYCLNRAENSESAQREASTERGLSTHLFTPDKVTFLTAALDLKHLGLSHTEYYRLRSSVTVVIHNAWPVNFNIPLGAFIKPLEGLLNLIALTTGSTHQMSIFYISSIGSVMGLSSRLPRGSFVPEETLSDPSAPQDIPYCQSKYIGENIIDYAASKYGVNGSSIRVGQIAGPVSTEGMWQKHEWLPSLIISSKHLGALPRSLGGDGNANDIDWVPVDLLAKVVAEIVLSNASIHGVQRPGARIFHPLNPRPVSWDSLLPSIVSKLNKPSSALPNSRLEVQTVPFEDWISLLRQSGEALDAKGAVMQTILEVNPGLKLLKYYEGLVRGDADNVGIGGKLSIERTMAASEILRGLNGVCPEWMDRWIDRWFSQVSV